MTAVLGSATAVAAAKIIDLAKPFAAEALDCCEDDLNFTDGLFLRQDTNRSIGIEDLVRQLAASGEKHRLNWAQPYETDGATYPYGCHIIELEIDRLGLSDYVKQVLIPTEKVYQIRNGKKVSKEKQNR